MVQLYFVYYPEHEKMEKYDSILLRLYRIESSFICSTLPLDRCTMLHT